MSMTDMEKVWRADEANLEEQAIEILTHNQSDFETVIHRYADSYLVYTREIILCKAARSLYGNNDSVYNADQMVGELLACNTNVEYGQIDVIWNYGYTRDRLYNLVKLHGENIAAIVNDARDDISERAEEYCEVNDTLSLPAPSDHDIDRIAEQLWTTFCDENSFSDIAGKEYEGIDWRQAENVTDQIHFM